jgi:parallel beta-helix repeat protein
MKKIIIFPLMLLLMVFPCSAAIKTVCNSGCDYTSIQAAVNAAAINDTISIGSGVYYEDVIVPKPLQLIGVYRETAIVSTGSMATIACNTSDVIIKNLIIPFSYIGVLIDSTQRIQIDHCFFEGNAQGIKILESHDILMHNNNFVNQETGILIDISYSNQVNNNDFSNSSKGISLVNSANNSIVNNTFDLCNISAIMLRKSHSNKFDENNILSSSVGISAVESSGNQISANNASTTSLFLNAVQSSQNNISNNYVDYSSKYAKDTKSSGNVYTVKGMSFSGEQFEFSLLDILAPTGFGIFSDVLNMTFVSDIFRQGFLTIHSIFDAGLLSGYDNSTIGMYTYEDNGFTLIQKSVSDGSFSSLDSQVMDAASMYSIISDYGKDIDGNGLFEYLALKMNILLPKDANYLITGSLYDSTNKLVTTEMNFDMHKGVNSIELLFNGGDIKNTSNGVFQLKSLNFISDNNYITEQKPNIYQTASYITSQFTQPSYGIFLNSGWNLISIPVLLTNKSVQSVFVGLSYESVWAYVNGAWQSSSPTRPAFLNTLQTVNETLGIWVRMNSAGTLSFQGISPSSTSIALNIGWNLVGYPSLTNRTVTDALQSISGNYASVFMYKNNVWYSYDPSRPAFLNTLTTVVPGYGYWIKAIADDTLEINN